MKKPAVKCAMCQKRRVCRPGSRGGSLCKDCVGVDDLFHNPVYLRQLVEYLERTRERPYPDLRRLLAAAEAVVRS